MTETNPHTTKRQLHSNGYPGHTFTLEGGTDKRARRVAKRMATCRRNISERAAQIEARLLTGESVPRPPRNAQPVRDIIR
jgi:hypothetical protein